MLMQDASVNTDSLMSLIAKFAFSQARGVSSSPSRLRATSSPQQSPTTRAIYSAPGSPVLGQSQHQRQQQQLEDDVEVDKAPWSSPCGRLPEIRTSSNEYPQLGVAPGGSNGCRTSPGDNGLGTWHQQQQMQPAGHWPGYRSPGVSSPGLQLGVQEVAGFSRTSPGSPRLLNPGAERLIEAAKLLRQQEVLGISQVRTAGPSYECECSSLVCCCESIC